MHMLLTGEPISADDAARAGLVNQVAEHGRERAEALALAEKIAAKSSHVVKIGKKAFYEQAQMPLTEAYDYAAKVMTENMMARDANEGICAFIEKRTPHWEDK
jgi:enoyl-CoA hydratase/carnithine racemase